MLKKLLQLFKPKWNVQMYITVVMKDEQVMGTAIRKAVEAINDRPEFTNVWVQQVIPNDNKSFTLVVNVKQIKKFELKPTQ